MKVKDMIRKLQTFNPEKEVSIRFAVSPEDEIGYTLETIDVDRYFDDYVIYASYEDKKGDCEFIGQVYLTEAYEEYGQYRELKEKINRIKKEVSSYLGVEKRLKRKNIKPDSFDEGIFYISNNINEILKGNKDDN